ncbi:MAG: PAS domain S-box protein [Desulfitobacterium hafniense]|nr:PAS domain S-box protein [Desulfitobacterium hafniense]
MVFLSHETLDNYLGDAEKYQFLFNMVNDAIFFHVLNGNFVEVNDVACKLLGYSREELLQMSPKDLDDPDYPKPDAVQTLMREGRVVIEMVHICKDGRKLPVELNARLIELGNKKLVLTIARDIGERKRTERLEKERNKQLEKLYQQAEERALRISATNQIIKVIGSSLDFKETLRAFGLEAAKLIVFDYMNVVLVEECQHFLIHVMYFNEQKELNLSEVKMVSIKTEPFRSVLSSKECEIIRNGHLSEHNKQRLETQPLDTELSSSIIIPLNYENSIIGMLEVGCKSPEKYGEKELSLLTDLGDHLAVAIQNSRLHKKVQEMAVIIERNRIAHEIHDSSLQVLGYFRAKGELVERLIEHGHIEEARRAAHEIQDVAIEAYNEAREAIHALTERIPEGKTFIQVVCEYIRKVSPRWGIAIDLRAPNNLPFLERTVELQLFRIIQEALANVRKHSRAQHVYINCKLLDKSLIIEIKDDGKGFDVAQITGNTFGFTAMKERAASICGRLKIDSEVGIGTTITVELSLI